MTKVPAKLTKKKDQGIIVWYDTLREEDHYETLGPDQIINRIPNSNLMCRKAPFIRLMHRMQVYRPNEYNFIPKSYILPYEKAQFMEAVQRHDRKYIIKSDTGSLGHGIRVIEENEDFELTDNILSIAQEYVDSYLLDNTKFDLRVFVLIASVQPLRVWVFRDGIARFCSEPSNTTSIYSRLTNTAINKKNPNAKIENMTKTIQETFEKMARNGVDIDTLWSKIDRIIMLTIISSLGFLRDGEDKKCPSKTRYSRCFQILGFDVLIGKDLEPMILEVNFRPSMAADTVAERQLKMNMLSNALRIISNYFVRGNLKSLETDKQRKRFLEKHNSIVKIRPNDSGVRFEEIYPTNGPYSDLYKEMIEISNLLPTEMYEPLRMPVMVTQSKQKKEKTTKGQQPKHSADENAKRKVSHTPNIQQECVARLRKQNIDENVSEAHTGRKGRVTSAIVQDKSGMKVISLV